MSLNAYNPPKPVFVVFVDRHAYHLGDFDQICASEVEAMREVKSFKRMGYGEAFFKPCRSEQMAYDWQAFGGGCKRAPWPKP